MKARYLRKNALEELREAVPDNLSKYRAGSFSYLTADPSRYFEAAFDFDATKLAGIQVGDDGAFREEDNCAICYRALPELTPYEARDERLWVYFTHTHLLPYSRMRWPIPDDVDAAVSHIRTHFFARDKRQIERDNAVSRLWWMAHLCKRVEDLPLEESLRVLLYKSDVRANIIERPTASQCTEVFSAIVKKLHTSFNGEKKLFDRAKFRPLMMRINSIGGVKLLDCMSERQLSALLTGIIEHDLGMQTL